MRVIEISVLIIYLETIKAAVLDKDPKYTSDSRKMHGRPLAGVPHSDVPGDYDYDHDAFLGQELSSQFDALSPEESKRRLGILLDKIDADSDGFLTQEELKSWIEKVQGSEARRDTDSLWSEKVAPGHSTISWIQYRNLTYGFMEENSDTSETLFPGGYNFTSMMVRDERRFLKADLDNNGVLDRLEFQAFAHPEESLYMRDIVVQETMEDMDRNGDGRISIKEFIDDLWKGQEGEEEPGWVSAERDQFTQHRDKDGDGFLSFLEVKDWIVPEDLDLPLVEAHHLIVTVDSNNDDKLTKEEILDRHDVFVGSQATQYGELLNRHDEF